MFVHTFNTSTEHISEVEASLVYTVSSRPARPHLKTERKENPSITAWVGKHFQKQNLNSHDHFLFYT